MADNAFGPVGGCAPRLRDETGRVAHRATKSQRGFTCFAGPGLYVGRAAQSPPASPNDRRAVNIRPDSGTRRFRDQAGQRESSYIVHAPFRIRPTHRVRYERAGTEVVGEGAGAQAELAGWTHAGV